MVSLSLNEKDLELLHEEGLKNLTISSNSGVKYTTVWL